jgi:hypothetical protein
MPSQDHPSRRSVLRGAGIGAAGLAVAAAGGGAIAAVTSQSRGDAATLSAADAAGSGPIVIYLKDPRSGEMDIYAGTGKTHHRNTAMAAMVASMAPKR